MRKVADYRKHAEDCRVLARRAAPGEERDQLMKMAQTWELLAEERDRATRLTEPAPDPADPQNKPQK